MNGTGFVILAQVRWNGPSPDDDVRQQHIQPTAAIPASDIAAAGTRPVTVVNPGASASNALTFTITTPPGGGSPGTGGGVRVRRGHVPDDRGRLEQRQHGVDRQRNLDDVRQVWQRVGVLLAATRS